MLGLGGLGDLGGILRGVQEMQRKMAEVQESLARQTVVGESGGDMVKATMNGRGELLRVDVDPTLMTEDDREMVQELIVVAVNNASARAKELGQQEMNRLLGEANIPPGMLNMLGMNQGS